MRKKMKRILMTVAVLLGVGMLSGFSFASETVTIVGTVNLTGQIDAGEDTVYDIADTDKGYELMLELGKKVAVNGTVQEDEGQKVITVESYQILEE